MDDGALFALPATGRPPRPPAPTDPGRRSYDDIDRWTYLGTHQPHWLTRTEFTEQCVPLCIAHHRLNGYRTLPRAVTPWMLDSGAYQHLTEHGQWKTSPYAYAKAARRYYDEIGKMDMCAIQDWMTEDEVMRKTGLTVYDHQIKTIASYLNLLTLDEDLPWFPVIQGRTMDDFLRHIDLYDQAGIDLTLETVVGIGSVCRLQRTRQAARIIERIWQMGIRLHGFGLKITGLRNVADLLYSSDSMAWSYNAIFRAPMPGCEQQHAHCGNCPKYALAWRNKLLNSLPDYRQIALPA